MNFENMKTFDPTLFREKYRIKSNRHPSWDYSGYGVYFITICSKGMMECFGEIRNGIMGLNELGCVAAQCWQDIPNHFKNVELDEWTVMPNHIHGIVIVLKTNDVTVGTRHGVNSGKPLLETHHGASLRCFGSLESQSLSSIINHFKGAVTRNIHKNHDPHFSWQSGYYDHVIRDAYSWNSINWHNPIRHFDPPEAGGEEIPLPIISFKIGSDDIVSFYYGLAICIKPYTGVYWEQPAKLVGEPE